MSCHYYFGNCTHSYGISAEVLSGDFAHGLDLDPAWAVEEFTPRLVAGNALAMAQKALEIGR